MTQLDEAIARYHRILESEPYRDLRWVKNLQEQMEAQQGPPAPAAAPAPSAGISSDTMQKLEDLGKLHEQGILTDDEFAQQKARLLA